MLLLQDCNDFAQLLKFCQLGGSSFGTGQNWKSDSPYSVSMHFQTSFSQPDFHIHPIQIHKMFLPTHPIEPGVLFVICPPNMIKMFNSSRCYYNSSAKFLGTLVQYLKLNKYIRLFVHQKRFSGKKSDFPLFL